MMVITHSERIQNGINRRECHRNATQYGPLKGRLNMLLLLGGEGGYCAIHSIETFNQFGIPRDSLHGGLNQCVAEQ